MFSSLPPPDVTPQSGPGQQALYDNPRLLERLVDKYCDDCLGGDILVKRYGLPAIGSERKERQLREQLQLEQQQYQQQQQQHQLSRDSSQETNQSLTSSSNEAAASITPATTASASGSPPNGALTFHFSLSFTSSGTIGSFPYPRDTTLRYSPPC